MENEAIKTKVCSRCGRELPRTEFPKNAQSRDGHLGVCKKCHRKRMNDYRRNLAEKARLYDMRGGLKDYTPRDLMLELKRRGYEGVLSFTERKTIDISRLDDNQ